MSYDLSDPLVIAPQLFFLPVPIKLKKKKFLQHRNATRHGPKAVCFFEPGDATRCRARTFNFHALRNDPQRIVSPPAPSAPALHCVPVAVLVSL